jgi:hypothetical protein
VGFWSDKTKAIGLDIAGVTAPPSSQKELHIKARQQ